MHYNWPAARGQLMGLRPGVFMAKEVILWLYEACKPLTRWTWCRSMRNSTSGCAAQNSVCLSRMLGTDTQWSSALLFCWKCCCHLPSYHGIHFRKMCSGRVSNKCFWSLAESSGLPVCPIVFLALAFIPNILCFSVSFHNSSFYPWEADAASLFLSLLTYFNTPSRNFTTCLCELSPLFCLLIKFYFNFLGIFLHMVIQISFPHPLFSSSTLELLS